MTNAQIPDTAQVYSESMQKNIPALIILPENYDASATKLTYPALYMLHGHSGDFIGYYFHMADLQTLANQYQMILVCPDGGYNSWYMDAPIGTDCKYETFISFELTSYVDKNYSTRPHKDSRAICGISMGGYGALYNAIRHPDIFGAAGSMSGAVDFTPFPTEWQLSDRLGPYLLNKKRWESYSLINMIGEIPKDLAILVDVGVRDFFVQVNRNFHNKLLQAHIPHDYIEREGDHDWNYWANACRFQMLFFHHFFNKS